MPRELRIGYLSKFPPSESGVAHYAALFEKALSEFGTVERVETAASATQTQRLRLVLRTSGRLAARGRRFDILHVELSGRALAEFYAALCWRLLPWHRGRRLSLTIHDAPEVIGGAFFFSLLDRRGFRSLAAALSRAIGIRMERFLLRRADHVFCLSRLGAESVSQRLHVPMPSVIPHVAELCPVRATREASPLTVFCPGYTGAPEVQPALEALSQLDATDATLVIGACSREAEDAIRMHASRLGLSGRIRFTGLIRDFSELLAVFANADLVVRIRPWAWRPANWAAVSGPIIWAMAHGCAVITNDARGVEDELRESGAGLVVRSPEALVPTIVRALTDKPFRDAVGTKAHRVIANRHVPHAVARALVELELTPLSLTP